MFCYRSCQPGYESDIEPCDVDNFSVEWFTYMALYAVQNILSCLTAILPFFANDSPRNLTCAAVLPSMLMFGGGYLGVATQKRHCGAFCLQTYHWVHWLSYILFNIQRWSLCATLFNHATCFALLRFLPCNLSFSPVVVSCQTRLSGMIICLNHPDNNRDRVHNGKAFWLLHPSIFVVT